MERRSARNLRPTTADDGVFIRRVLIVAALVVLGVAVWALTDILLLAFAAVLFALILRAIAEPIAKRTGMSDGAALAVAGSVVVALVAGVVLLLGPLIAPQLEYLIERLPGALKNLADEWRLGSAADLLRGSSIGNLVAGALAWSTAILGAVASLLVVFFAGVYIAVNPGLYRDGLLKLFPPSWQPQVGAALSDAGKALQNWLGGQLMAMLLVGVLTGLGMWLAGVPSALALGFIAGLTEFVPIVGPVAGAIPALLIASTQDMETVLWALGVVVAVQQIENNLIMPLLIGRTVQVAPAVGLFAVIALGVLFGPLGLLLGFPLAVVIDAAVRRLYVRGMLGEDVEILRETATPGDAAA